MYVYIQSETNLWTVGFYNPEGKWIAESDHPSSEEAADRVAYLNCECTKFDILHAKYVIRDRNNYYIGPDFLDWKTKSKEHALRFTRQEALNYIDNNPYQIFRIEDAS